MSINPREDGIGEVGVNNNGICAGLQLRIAHSKGGEALGYIFLENDLIRISVDQIGNIFLGLLHSIARKLKLYGLLQHIPSV